QDRAVESPSSGQGSPGPDRGAARETDQATDQAARPGAAAHHRCFNFHARRRLLLKPAWMQACIRTSANRERPANHRFTAEQPCVPAPTFAEKSMRIQRFVSIDATFLDKVPRQGIKALRLAPRTGRQPGD